MKTFTAPPPPRVLAGFLTDSCSQGHLLFFFYTSMLLCVLKIIAECPVTHTGMN